MSTGVKMLRARGISGAEAKLEELVQRYSGNPLALKLVADTAHSLFAGDIDMLIGEAPVFGDIYDVLNEQISRLSPLEDEILTWLAIEREPVTSQTILDDLAIQPHKSQLLEALRSLYFRSLLEQALPQRSGKRKGVPRYTLQNVVMTYATSRLVEAVCQEILSGVANLLQQYALLKAHTKEYIQESQRRLLLEPVAQWLVNRLGKAGAVKKLHQLLETVRAEPALTLGYAGANILHLLVAVGEELHGTDFSRLTIRQADLRAVILHNVSFKGSDLRGSIFRDTFSLVINLVFSPDGQFLAAGTADRSITLWRLHEYQPHLIIQRPAGFDLAIAFSPDGQVLAGGGNDHIIRLWDAATGKEIRSLDGHSGQVTAVCFSPDGSSLYSSSDDLTIRVWDVNSGQLLRQIPTPGNIILTLAVSPDGQFLAGGGYDGNVYLWGALLGKLIHQLSSDQEKKIKTIAFSPDGDTLAAGGEDNEVHLWHVKSAEKFVSLREHNNFVLSVAFHPDGTTLASGSADKTVRLWDWRQGHSLRVIHGSANWVTSVAYSPDGAIIAGGGYDRTIRLWQSHNGHLLHALQGSLRNVNEVVYSPDGSLIASASFDQPVRLWDAHNGRLLHLLQGHRGSIRRLVFSPDGHTLAVSGDGHALRLWDPQTGKLQQSLATNGNFVRSLAFSPDGNLLAAGIGLGYGTLMVWETDTGRVILRQPDVRTSLELSFCFTSDGRFLAYSDSSHVIRITNINDDTNCFTLTGHEAPIELLRFSPNFSFLVSQDKDGNLTIWHVGEDGSIKPQTQLQGNNAKVDTWNLVFSPDSQRVAFQIDGDYLGIVDINDGQLCCTVKESLYGERCLAFSADGELLITSSDGGNLRLWDVETGACRRTLQESVVGTIDVNPRDGRVASGGDDGVIRIWDIQTGICDLSLTPSGPYDGMDISGAAGLSPAQVATLEALGAVTRQ